MKKEKLKIDIDKHCRFCNPPDKERILFESENFYVMLSLGPIVEGYLLIVSKEHFESCGLIPKELGNEFDTVLNIVREILTKEYGSCIFYEHGRAGSCLTFSEGSKHCYHAHMHCIPANIELNSLIQGTLSPINCKSWNEFRSIAKEYNEPYLFVDDGVKQLHFVVKGIRRQYLRYLTSQQLGNKELWNWIEIQGWDKINSANKKLAKYFNDVKTNYVN